MSDFNSPVDWFFEGIALKVNQQTRTRLIKEDHFRICWPLCGRSPSWSVCPQDASRTQSLITPQKTLFLRGENIPPSILCYFSTVVDYEFFFLFFRSSMCSKCSFMRYKTGWQEYYQPLVEKWFPCLAGLRLRYLAASPQYLVTVTNEFDWGVICRRFCTETCLTDGLFHDKQSKIAQRGFSTQPLDTSATQ